MDASQKKVLVIVLVVVVGIGSAGLVGLLLIGAIGVRAAAGMDQARVDSARTDAAALESAATLFVVQNGGDCPTPESLVESRVVADAARTIDPWDHPFRITCEGDAIDVSSAGPDGAHGTEDDVAAP